MKVKSVNVISIDFDVYTNIKMYGASIYAKHSSTIHLSLNTGEIITLGSKISESKHHILVDEDLKFTEIKLDFQQKINVENNCIIIGNLKIEINDESIIEFKSYDTKYKYNQNALLNSKLIKKEINELSTIIDKDKIYDYIYSRVLLFLNKPNFKNAKTLIGLGPGLTPFGDDVLTGYLMGINSVNYSIDWGLDLLEEVKKHTNQFSYQNIKDTYKGFYPHMYVNMIEEIFNYKKINHALEVLKIGHTSGIGIVLGFLYGIETEENIR